MVDDSTAPDSPLKTWRERLDEGWREYYSLKGEWSRPSAVWREVQAKAEELWKVLDGISLGLRASKEGGEELTTLRKSALELRILLTWYVSPEALPAEQMPLTGTAGEVLRESQISICSVNVWARTCLAGSHRPTGETCYDYGAIVLARQLQCPVFEAEYFEDVEVRDLIMGKPVAAESKSVGRTRMGVPGTFPAAQWITFLWPADIKWFDMAWVTNSNIRFKGGVRRRLESLVEWTGKSKYEHYTVFYHETTAWLRGGRVAPAEFIPVGMSPIGAGEAWGIELVDLAAVVYQSEFVADPWYVSADEVARHMLLQYSSNLAA